jgi:F0F1-type ATP synthase membrane subunit b/b'
VARPRFRLAAVLRLAALLSLLLVPVSLPAQTQRHPNNEAGEANTIGKWKLINFTLFAIGFGYLIYRYAPAFFNARSADIQKAIRDATGLKMDADFRSSEMDRKMATLAEEVKKLRDQSAVHMELEHQKVENETQAELARIENNVRAEIEAFRQRGLRRVRQQTSRAALELASRRLQPQPGSPEQEELIQDLVHAVEAAQAAGRGPEVADSKRLPGKPSGESVVRVSQSEERGQ